MNTYITQTLVRITTLVTTFAGVPINPTTIALKLETPDGVVSDISGSIVNDSTGNYHADYPAAIPGVHSYEWISTGAAQVSSVGQFLALKGVV